MQMSTEKISLIKSKLKNGEPEGEIKEQLKREGYSDVEISKAFLAHHYDMRMWYLIFGVLISLFGLYNLIMEKRFLFLILGGVLIYTYFQERKRLRK